MSKQPGSTDARHTSGLARRDVLRLGAGAIGLTIGANAKAAQQQPGREAPAPRATGASERAAPPKEAASIVTRSGYRNDANRLGGNGPMDNTTRDIVRYVKAFSVKDVSSDTEHAAGTVMVDSIAALIAGFESEPARICARLSQTVQGSMKSSVMGYGVVTTPEMASFANACMLRHTDFNDLGPGGHVSDILSAPLAIGEAIHASGAEMLEAIVLGYEVAGALQAAGAGTAFGFGWDGPYEGPAAAMAVGKLLKLDEDRLANALSLTMVAHLPMSVTHVGALSHWKGCHAPEYVKCAVWSTLLAKEGMTGPAQPFEGRQGWFDHVGPFVRELRLPVMPRMVIERMGFKRTPTEGSSQAILEVIPQFRQWTKPEEIAAIHVELAQGGWMEIGDSPKWDPRNRETADHSMPYMICRSLMDGELYLDSFTPAKFMDPAVRRLMDKLTMSANPKCAGLGPYRITVKKTSGEEMAKEWLPPTVDQGGFHTAMSDADVVTKLKRVCAFMHVSDGQRDRALAAWSDMKSVKDIAVPIQDLARYGNPKPLNA